MRKSPKPAIEVVTSRIVLASVEKP